MSAAAIAALAPGAPIPNFCSSTLSIAVARLPLGGAGRAAAARDWNMSVPGLVPCTPPARSGRPMQLPASVVAAQPNPTLVMEPALLAGLLCPAVRVALLCEGVAATGGGARAALLRAADAAHSALPALSAWDAAALLAMAGVGTSVSHAWPVSHAAAEALLHGVLARSAGGATPLAEAVRSVFLPLDEAATAAAAAAAAAHEATAAAA
jgi:hypothetical protein